MNDDISEEELEELTKDNAMLQLMQQIAALASELDWEGLDALFTDEMLADDELKYTMVCDTRFYDNWLTKRQDFVEKLLAQDLEAEDEERFAGHLRKWMEDCRYFDIKDAGLLFIHPAVCPAGFRNNPELVKELLDKEEQDES